MRDYLTQKYHMTHLFNCSAISSADKLCGRPPLRTEGDRTALQGMNKREPPADVDGESAAKHCGGDGPIAGYGINSPANILPRAARKACPKHNIAWCGEAQKVACCQGWDVVLEIITSLNWNSMQASHGFNARSSGRQDQR